MTQNKAAIVGVDYSAGSDGAVLEALALQAEGHLGTVHLVHVVPVVDGHVRRHIADDALVVERELAHLRAHALQVVERVQTTKTIDLAVHVAIGHPGRQLLQTAIDHGGDMIVLGPHRRLKLDPRAIGRTARWVLDHAHCPVLIARREERAYLERSETLVPPCEACIDVRRASRGESQWCEVHARPHQPSRGHFEYVHMRVPPSVVGSLPGDP